MRTLVPVTTEKKESKEIFSHFLLRLWDSKWKQISPKTMGQKVKAIFPNRMGLEVKANLPNGTQTAKK